MVVKKQIIDILSECGITIDKVVVSYSFNINYIPISTYVEHVINMSEEDVKNFIVVITNIKNSNMSPLIYLSNFGKRFCY